MEQTYLARKGTPFLMASVEIPLQENDPVSSKVLLLK